MRSDSSINPSLKSKFSVRAHKALQFTSSPSVSTPTQSSKPVAFKCLTRMISSPVFMLVAVLVMVVVMMSKAASLRRSNAAVLVGEVPAQVNRYKLHEQLDLKKSVTTLALGSKLQFFCCLCPPPRGRVGQKARRSSLMLMV